MGRAEGTVGAQSGHCSRNSYHGVGVGHALCNRAGRKRRRTGLPPIDASR